MASDFIGLQLDGSTSFGLAIGPTLRGTFEKWMCLEPDHGSWSGHRPFYAQRLPVRQGPAEEKSAIPALELGKQMTLDRFQL